MNPEQIKDWLKKIEKDRFWLAEQCGVAKSTVDGWMSKKSKRPIPKPSQAIISGLMYNDSPFAPKFKLEEFAKIQQRAKLENISVDAWIERAILAALMILAIAFTCFHRTQPASNWPAKSLVATEVALNDSLMP